MTRASPSPGSLPGLLLFLVVGLAGGLLLPAATAVAMSEPPAAAVSVPPEPAPDPPIVTLASGRNLDECISALPKPDCRTSKDTDAKQIAVFSLLIGGLVLIGWRIVRATRQRDRAAASAGPP